MSQIVDYFRNLIESIVDAIRSVIEAILNPFLD